MEFNSYLFTLGFLPCIIILYFLLQKAKTPQLAKILLILGSLCFVGYAGRENFLFLVVSIFVNYALAKMLNKREKKDIISRLIVGVGVLTHLGILSYTKYSYFLADNLETYAGILWEPGDIFVPIGISFVTFQQIAYLVDVYREKIEKLDPVDYVLYVLYFPKYIQGPITRYSLFEEEINKEEGRKFNADNFACGLWLFITGLAKKVLLADVFAGAVSWGMGNAIENLTAVDAILVMLSFTFQIYFDFSGYSHMAIGISRMLNISLPDNFDSPYQSLSVVDFWKRWHISLTGFLREYLYFPLGGSRKGKARYYSNMFLVFFISGIWHGASWTYIVWGALQGAAYCLNKAFYQQWNKMNRGLQWFLTFIFINISWLFFRAPSVGRAFEFLRKIGKMEGMAVSEGLSDCFRIPEFLFVYNYFDGVSNFVTKYRGIEMFGFLLVALILALKLKDKCTEKFEPTIGKCIISVAIFCWSVISFSNVVEYIYGGF